MNYKQIVFIFHLVFASAFSFSQAQLTLEDIWMSRKFVSESVHGINSMKDGLHYTSLENFNKQQAIVKYSYKTGKAVDTLLKSAQIKEGFVIEAYRFSPDEKKLLVATETESIYRHSTQEIYYIYDLTTKKHSLLSKGSKQRYADFSPGANKVAFVRENNIFIADIEKGEEVQVTFDGKQNEIINGSADWVYEEEFGFDKAFFWSPDGSKIAYYRFDESLVKEFSMDMYGALYPTQYKFKYPKAGEENSKVEIFIYDLKKRVPIRAAIPETIGEQNGKTEYIPRIKWTATSQFLSVQAMNRHQNVLNLYLVNSNSGESKLLLSETANTYIDISDNLTFLSDQTGFIWTSEKDGYNHIYHYDITGTLIKQVTSGKWDVIGYKGMDEKSGTIFYISAEDSPLERYLYTIKNDGTQKKKISSGKGTNDAVFSEGMKYFINYHTDANNPMHITLHDASGKEIRVLKSNEKLRTELAKYTFSKKEFFSFKNPEGTELKGWMIKPWNFDASKKYPVLMFVYGGPGSQTVQDNWGGANFLWYQYLASKGFIVASVDNRGTGARGAEFKKITYKQLGKYETEDQISAAKYLGSLPFADATRIAIQGWSYGGYMSSLCITKGADVFKAAIAVAPVSNWRYYDSIYTERYMQTPQENDKGYDENSPINHMDKLKGKYLLVHGTADDNVHFQNSVELVNALIKANKQFDFYIYPDKNHSIFGGNSRLHLYTKMTDFLLQNL